MKKLIDNLRNATEDLMKQANRSVNDFSTKIRETNNGMSGSDRPLSPASNDFLKNLSLTIDQNVDTMNEQGVDDNSPVFMKNYIAEQIQKDNQDNVRNTNSQSRASLVTSSVEVADEDKIMTAQHEKDGKANQDKGPPVPLLTKAAVRELRGKLKERVFGQDESIEEIFAVLKVAALNIKINEEKPAGCYFFAGPSGCGKTELGESIAAALDAECLRIDCGEYGLEPDVTKLIGTSKGYVGYNEGGLLTNFVTEKKRCVIILDELEKAHSSIDKILLSIMDKGVCTDNKGNPVPFKETIVICTSNLGAEVEYITGLDKSEKDRIRMESIKQGLRPEIINRFDSVFHFNALTPEIYEKVTNKFLSILDKRMKKVHDFEIKYTPKLVQFIVDKSYDPAMGGRPARKFIEKVIVNVLSDYMLEDNFDDLVKETKVVTMDLNKDKNVCFKIKSKIIGVLENTEELVSRIEEGKFTNKKVENVEIEEIPSPTEPVQVIPTAKTSRSKLKK